MILKLKDLITEKCQKGYKTHPTRKTKIMFGRFCFRLRRLPLLPVASVASMLAESA